MKLSGKSIKIIAWVISTIIAIALYLPIIAALAETPIHNGSELPSRTMLLIALAISIIISIISAKTIQKWLTK